MLLSWKEIAMGQALDQKKEEKKKNLLEAARILFLQKGFSKTSISEIAKQAKVKSLW